jgi:hypothetical protein
MENRSVQIPQLAGDVAQHEIRYVGVWFEFCSPFKEGPGCRGSMALSLLQTFIDQCGRTRR